MVKCMFLKIHITSKNIVFLGEVYGRTIKKFIRIFFRRGICQRGAGKQMAMLHLLSLFLGSIFFPLSNGEGIAEQ